MTSKPPFGGEAVRLNQLCSKGKSNLRQKDIENDGPFNVYGASGIVGRMDTYQNERPYVGIVKDGAGVGRAMLCEGKTSVLGTMQALLPNEGTNLSYLLHLVRSLKLGENYSGSTIPHIYFKDYGRQEVTAPVRTVTSTVPVIGGQIPVVSVKTAGDVPKDSIFDVMRDIRSASVTAPVKIGDVIVRNAGGTGTDVIATKAVGIKD